MKKILFSIAVVCAFAAQSRAQSPFSPIASGYGANGPYAMTDDKFPSPLYDNEKVHVFRPAGLTGKAPVVFFAPGYGNNDPDEYRFLIRHVVSRGYALVYAPFQVIAISLSPQEKRYDTIFAGFDEAVKRYGASFDLDRVGYMGHSYGAAAIFAMSLRGAAKGWGRQALFLHAMAPWYSFEITTRQYATFPAHAKVLIEVFEDDGVCDHRMAREIYERLNLPASEKEFVMLRSEERLGYRLDASHGTPSGGTVDALDYYGLYRLFDALAEYSITGSAAAKRVALGNGSPEQRAMGVWADGKPVRELIAGDCVAITRPSGSFLFPDVGSTDEFAAVSSASLRLGPLAPDSLATAYGEKLSASASIAPNGPQEKLNGTTVRVKDGACREWVAPIFYASPSQVNYLLPSALAPGTGSITIFNEAGGIAIADAQFAPVSPGLFAANGNGQGAASASVLRVKPNGAQVFEKAVQFNPAQNRFLSVPIDLGIDGDQVFLLLFGTGLRYRSQLSAVTATIGGTPVEVLYAGGQGNLAGLDQLNLRLPKSLAGRGELDVVLKADGRTANVVRVSFK